MPRASRFDKARGLAAVTGATEVDHRFAGPPIERNARYGAVGVRRRDDEPRSDRVPNSKAGSALQGPRPGRAAPPIAEQTAPSKAIFAPPQALFAITALRSIGGSSSASTQEHSTSVAAVLSATMCEGAVRSKVRAMRRCPGSRLRPTNADRPDARRGRAIAKRLRYWNATSAKLRSLRLCSDSTPPCLSSSIARMPMRGC